MKIEQNKFRNIGVNGITMLNKELIKAKRLSSEKRGEMVLNEGLHWGNMMRLADPVTKSEKLNKHHTRSNMIHIKQIAPGMAIAAYNNTRKGISEINPNATDYVLFKQVTPLKTGDQVATRINRMLAVRNGQSGGRQNWDLFRYAEKADSNAAKDDPVMHITFEPGSPQWVAAHRMMQHDVSKLQAIRHPSMAHAQGKLERQDEPWYTKLGIPYNERRYKHRGDK